MENKPTNPKFDISSLRLPANYGATFGVKKLLTNVPVSKPSKQQFFRAHQSEEMVFDGFLLEKKDSQENYLLVPEVASVVEAIVRPVRLHAAIDRQNNVFLIPVPLPNESGNRYQSHEALAQAVELSKTKWIRMNWNGGVKSYDIFEAAADIPDPEWPNHTIDQLVDVGFRGKVIADIGHPVIQTLLGRM